MTTLSIRGGTVLTPQGQQRVDLLLKDGRIAHIGQAESEKKKVAHHETIDASDYLVLPGLIDCHVHFREPGLTHKGDIASESAAAIAGGVTTACDMPNTVPPTVTIEALRAKVERAELTSACDLRFFFGATASEHLIALETLFMDPLHRDLRARCCGLKLYIDHSTGNQKIDASLIDDAFAVSARLGIVVVCHCEDPGINIESLASVPDRGIEAHSLLRPAESEECAIAHAIDCAERHGTHLHIAHLSTMQGVELVRDAKKKGLSVTCEVAPHHLFLTEQDYEALGTLGKMNPPLRSAEHQEALWQGIAEGTIDCIATDHAPHTLEEKKNPEPLQAPSGVPGIEMMLPLLLTVAAGHWPHPHSQHSTFNIQPSDILRLCFTNPNRIFGLGKYGIVEGAPADLVLVDLNAAWTVRGAALHGKCGWTPYEGWNVKGKVVRTITPPQTVE